MPTTLESATLALQQVFRVFFVSPRRQLPNLLKNRSYCLSAAAFADSSAQHSCQGALSADAAAERDGGASRDRTDDPLLAKQVLSQLSYGPA